MAPWQNGPYKNQHRTTQKHAEHQDAIDIQKKTIPCVFSDFFIFLFIYNFLKMLGLYLYALLIGRKSCNMLSKLNK